MPSGAYAPPVSIGLEIPPMVMVTREVVITRQSSTGREATPSRTTFPVWSASIAFENEPGMAPELAEPLSFRASRSSETGNTPIESPVAGTLRNYHIGTSCRPMTPSYMLSQKYRRSFFPPKTYKGEIPRIGAVQTEFYRPDLPKSTCCTVEEFEWSAFVTPEGNLYFREKSKNIVTFVDLYNGDYRKGVSCCAASLLKKIARYSGKNILPENYEICIMLQDNGKHKPYECGYYLSSWEKRCVFWVDSVDYEFVTKDARPPGVCISPSHIGKQIERLFWVHVELFPNHRETPLDVVDELKDMLNSCIYDDVTSHGSIFPYDRADAAHILGCLNRVDTARRNARDLWIVARCAQEFARHAFINYHGEQGARVNKRDTVIAETPNRGSNSLLFMILSPLFLFLPNTHLEKIRNVWNDDVQGVNWVACKHLMQLFEESWQESIVPATVILSTNVGFLAIQSIDTNHPHRSVAQMAAYISSAFAFFNIITIQILKIRGSPTHLDATGAWFMLHRIRHQWLGLEWTALLFSLPATLLIWSMISFLVALMVVFFSGTSATTKAVMAAVMIVLSSIVVLLIWRHPLIDESYEAPQQTTFPTAWYSSGGIRYLKQKLVVLARRLYPPGWRKSAVNNRMHA